MKKIICAALALLLAVSALALFTGCGSKKDDELVMATNANFPPYEFVDDDGEYAGIDVEIAKAIAEKLGKKLVIANVEFGSIVGGVESGKYDMGMAGMTVTEDRLKSVNFSTSYATGIQAIIVPEDSPYTCLDDFYNMDAEGNYVSVKDGVKIGVQQDTTGDIYCSDTVENYGFGSENVTSYKNGADAVQALVSGKLAAVIIDNEPAKSFVKANTGLKILDTSYTEEQYAIAIAKGNAELLESINKALADLTAEGKIDEIIKKYIPAN